MFGNTKLNQNQSDFKKPSVRGGLFGSNTNKINSSGVSGLFGSN